MIKISLWNIFAFLIIWLKRLHVAHAVSYPTKIGQIVSKMTKLTQQSLQSRNSRMEIELPPIADFGVEAAKKNNKELSQSEKVLKTNREAARLFCEMFVSLSSTSVVLFPSEREALDARNLWGASFRGQVLSMEAKGAKGYGKLRSRRYSAEEQEQALLAIDGLYVPDGTEVLIIAGIRSKDWSKLVKLENKLGQDTLIILVNARASVIANTKTSTIDNAVADNSAGVDTSTWLSKTFVNVFHYAPPAVAETIIGERELLLYHEYKGKWYLAQKEKSATGGFLGGILGGEGFQTLWEGDERPTMEEISLILKP